MVRRGVKQRTIRRATAFPSDVSPENALFTSAASGRDRTRCHSTDGTLKMIDDPQRSLYRECSFFSGAGGLVSTAPDYFRFTAMLRNRSKLDGVPCSAGRRWS
jgi:CubicO group peptidase (beta-lactamase class C family)